jgi:hypothetical protein
MVDPGVLAVVALAGAVEMVEGTMDPVVMGLVMEVATDLVNLATVTFLMALTQMRVQLAAVELEDMVKMAEAAVVVVMVLPMAMHTLNFSPTT